jgi:hypothetical protein
MLKTVQKASSVKFRRFLVESRCPNPGSPERDFCRGPKHQLQDSRPEWIPFCAVLAEPLNFHGGNRGDILIRAPWAQGMDCIIDVRIADVDAKSEDSDKVSAAHEREKKKKHLGVCLEQRRHFSRFVASADGLLLDKEAKILLSKLSAMLTAKWEKPCSEVCGHVNARMSIAIVRATHL